MKDLSVAVVGTGAVGEHLALALRNTGFAVDCIVSRKIYSAQALADKVGAKFSVSLGNELPGGLDLLFLCVRDDVISVVAHRLGRLSYNWSGVCVAHTSGALTSQALETLAMQHASVFSFHPMQTFKKELDSNWDDIVIGIEGDDKGVAQGVFIARALGSIPLQLSARDKVLYHASAVFASNFFVAVVGMASDILCELQISRADSMRLLRPLIQNTCENILQANPEEALTGPASRGDIQTVKKHAEALRKSLPEKYHLYLELTREAVKLKSRGDSAFADKAVQMNWEIDQLSVK